MKKVLSVLLILVMVTGLFCTAFAAETEFVPSINEKPAPGLVEDENGNVGEVLDEDGNVIGTIPASCLLLTAVSRVEDSEHIEDAAKNALLYVYNALKNGDMTIPTEKLNENLDPDEITVRDLFDLSWTCEDHPAIVAPEGVTFRVTFQANVAADDEIFVMTYKNDEWNPIVAVVNNGDGTLTCTFENLCPVAFIYGVDEDVPVTGFQFNTEMVLWFSVMVVSAGALVAVVATHRKKEQA